MYFTCLWNIWENLSTHLLLQVPRVRHGEGNSSPLHYSCLEKNPMGRGAWQAAVHGVTKSQTRLSDFTFMLWRRKWQPTPVFLPGESQGRGSLVGCRLWVAQSRTRLKRLSSSSRVRHPSQERSLPRTQTFKTCKENFIRGTHMNQTSPSFIIKIKRHLRRSVLIKRMKPI